MREPTPQESVAAAATHITALAKSELRLARAEISQGARQFGMGLVFAVLSAVLVLLALGLLSAALVAWLVSEQGMAVWGAAVTVGGGQLVFALICALLARGRLNIDRVTPKRSLGNLKRDLDSLKELIHG
ncbi:phage holin family protein [Antarctobacter jejuensis]|uniref:phage holin family protein n=1 Tax=Antarctobacter jejuensis TaxID=1439938 RepID=UPI003FD1F084